jgi:hypothetical protein
MQIICIYHVQPGMVTTDLLMSGATTKQVRISPDSFSFRHS